MGTYKQPGVVINKSFEVINKSIADGTKAFIDNYNKVKARQATNIKRNLSIADQRDKLKKEYTRNVNVAEKELKKDYGVRFDDQQNEEIIAFGNEYADTKILMNTATGKELTKLERRLEQLKRIPGKFAEQRGAMITILNGDDVNPGYIETVGNGPTRPNGDWNLVYDNIAFDGSDKMSRKEENGVIYMVYDDPTTGEHIEFNGDEFVASAKDGIRNFSVNGDLEVFASILEIT